MQGLPDWVRKLRADAPLRGELQLDWLDGTERDFLRAEWLEIWDQVPFEEPFHGDNRARIERCVPLAQGVTRERRLSHTASRLALVWDPLEPDDLFISLSHALPPLLWVRANGDAASVRAATAPYLVEAGSVVDLASSVRVVKGLDVDRAVIESAIGNLELWLDDTTWSSGFEDAPWLNAGSPLSMIQQTVWRRDVVAEHEGRFASISYRTLWSKSVLRIEQHPFGMWVFDLRYNPIPGAAAALVNEVTGGHLPTDVPMDLAASLLRGEQLDEVTVSDQASRGERLIEQLAIRCGLAPGESATFERLRRAIDEHREDPEVLRWIADLASSYQYDQLLFEIAMTTPDLELATEMRRFLAPQEVAR